MRRAKVRAVARFEARSTMRRLGFWVVTLGMPLFALVYGALALIPGYLITQEASRSKEFGVVDEAQILSLTPRSRVDVKKVTFRVFADRASAYARLLAKETPLRTIYVLPKDYLDSGQVEAYTSSRSSLGAWEGARAFDALVRRRLAQQELAKKRTERIVRPVVERKSFRVDGRGKTQAETKEAVIGRVALPIAFVLLLFTSILMSGSYLIRATATEKENKVVEILISSASADEIMTGKLFGLGAAGLVQVMIWSFMTLILRLPVADHFAAVDLRLPWQALVLSPFLFLAAYAFLGSLMLGTGSLGANVRESQQLGMIWAALAAVPLIFLPLLLTEPHGLVAQVLTWVPFSAPAGLIFRLSLDPAGVSGWEIGGAMAVLLLSTYASLRIASRLFRVGIMLGGARPGWLEILRQARLKG